MEKGSTQGKNKVANAILVQVKQKQLYKILRSG